MAFGISYEVFPAAFGIWNHIGLLLSTRALEAFGELLVYPRILEY
jgi:hypothetical protein